MRRRAALLAAAAAAALLVASAAARADTTTITMPGKFFDPARSTVVAGDVVTFRNNDLVTHDVRIGGGIFDSGPIVRFTSWSQRIDQPGSYPFLCTLHAFMTGNLDVVAATLAAKPDGVLAGEPLKLSGRTAAGTPLVGIERSVGGDDWRAVGDPVEPAPDGTFTATVAAEEGASYRVATTAGPGQVVTPHVIARVDVLVEVHRGRRHTVVHVHTMPASPAFTATLQLYSRWHFRWRAVRSVRLDAHGGATFRLPPTRRALTRVVLRRGARGPALVHSGVVSLRTGRGARDPDATGAPMPGHDGGGDPHGGHH